MIRFGATSDQMRALENDDIFLLRLKLLIIMAKAYLKGYPLGNWRKSAVRENARFIFHYAHLLSRQGVEADQTPQDELLSDTDDILHRHVKRLAVMVELSADGNVLKQKEKQVLTDHINTICSHLSEQMHLTDFLQMKVA